MTDSLETAAGGTRSQTRSGLEGWPITAVAAAVLLAMTAAIFALGGWNEESVRSLVRATARTSLVLFCLAFAASSLRSLWRSSASAWLLRNRRYVGVSFAVSHYLHAVALIGLSRYFPTRFLDELEWITLVFGGGVGYSLITAMVLTSFDRAAAWLGRKRWRMLHLGGSWFVWFIFLQSYLPLSLTEPAYVPAALLIVTTPAIRLAPRLLRGRLRSAGA